MISSSMVPMRFVVSGPVFSIFCSALARSRPSSASDAARPEAFLEGRVLGIVGIFRLLFRIEVVEVAEELVEAVRGRQELVLVAQVVLAELAGRVAQRLQHLGDGRVFGLQADIGSRHADLGQARADRVLSGDEGGASRGAALLPVVVGEGDALVGDAVDVRRAVAHLPAAVVADVPPADVIAPENQDVRLASVLGHVSLPCRKYSTSQALPTVCRSQRG